MKKNEQATPGGRHETRPAPEAPVRDLDWEPGQEFEQAFAQEQKEQKRSRRRQKAAPAEGQPDGQSPRRKPWLMPLLLVLVIIFGIIFGYSAYQLYSILHEYKESERRYDSVANSAISTPAPTPVTTPYAVQPGEEQPSAPPVEQSPINVDFDNLLEQCKDIVGWIYCEDTVINYPMVRGNDNDYYLHRFIDGTYNGGGTLFMDFKCNRDFSDPNSIIYGHHMNDGSMFASLKKYQTDPEYYSKHPTLYVNTPTQNYRVDVFAGFVCDADSDTYTIGFTDDVSFQNWLNRMKSQSDFQADVEVTAEDHIITLSTCSYEWYDARYVVLGKLVPIG